MHLINEGLCLTDLSAIIHSMFGDPLGVVRCVCVCTLLVWWWDVAEGKCSVSILLNFHLLMGLCLWAFSQVLPLLYSSPAPLNETRRMEGAWVGAIPFSPLEIRLNSVLSSGVYYCKWRMLWAYLTMITLLFLPEPGEDHFYILSLRIRDRACEYARDALWIMLRLVHMQSPAIFQNYSYIFLPLVGCSNFYSR